MLRGVVGVYWPEQANNVGMDSKKGTVQVFLELTT